MTFSSIKFYDFFKSISLTIQVYCKKSSHRHKLLTRIHRQRFLMMNSKRRKTNLRKSKRNLNKKIRRMSWPHHRHRQRIVVVRHRVKLLSNKWMICMLDIDVDLMNQCQIMIGLIREVRQTDRSIRRIRIIVHNRW